MKVLTQSQVNFYNEKGYILVDNVLSKEEIKELSDVTDTFVEKSRSVTETGTREKNSFPKRSRLLRDGKHLVQIEFPCRVSFANGV